MKRDTAEAKKLVDLENIKLPLLFPKARVQIATKNQTAYHIGVFKFRISGRSRFNRNFPQLILKYFLILPSKQIINKHCRAAVEKIVANVQTEWVLDELQQQLSEGKEEAPKKIAIDVSKIMRVDQRFASENKYQGTHA